MAKTETLHVRVEPGVKINAEATLRPLGLSTTEAINMFLSQIILTGGIPFAIKLPEPKPETLAAMQEAMEVSKIGTGYTSMDALRTALNE